MNDQALIAGVIKIRKKTKPVHGVGINDADYMVQQTVEGRKVWCPFYSAWQNMLLRCYSAKYHERFPGYIGCSVTPEWHRFSVFRAWMISQDWEGNELDKDILFHGNKVYSTGTCVFVSGDLNKFLNSRSASRGEFPTGVCFHIHVGKFQASCMNPFALKKDHIGYFDNQFLAHEAWRRRKHHFSCQYADMQTDPRIAKALRERFATTTVAR